MISREEFRNSGYAEELAKYERNSDFIFNKILSDCAEANKDNKPLADFFKLLGQVVVSGLDKSKKFDQEFIDNVALVYQDIDNRILRARLAEFLSFRLSGKEKIEAVQVAIAGYTAEPISRKNRHFIDYWARGLYLADKFKQKAKFQQLKDVLLQQLYNDDNGIALDIADRCITPSLVNKTDANSIAAYFEKLARNKNDKSACSYYKKAFLFYKKAKNITKSNEMCFLKGQSLERLVIGKMGGSFMAKEMYYPKAIAAYQQIPKKHRPEGLDEHIKELRQDMLDSSRAAMENPEAHGITMRCIQFPIPDMTAQAKKIVSGKTFLSALSNLAQSMPWVQESAACARPASPLSQAGLHSTASSDGRILKFSENHPYGKQAANILGYYRIWIGVHSAGVIDMLNIIKKEHSSMTEADFLAITQGNPIIPPDRQGLVAKALYYGYQGDFSAALHLAIPQIEHIVRFHMQKAGILTTTQDDGDENEIGLSALLKKPEAEQVFDKDIIFELRSLLCIKGGPNLRNAVAHGLLNDEQSQNQDAVYAWRILLKLCHSQICDGKIT